MNSFSIFVARESGLHNLHPLTKATLALCLVIAGLVLPGRWVGYLLVLCVVFPLALWGKVFTPFLRSLWKVTLPLGLSLFLIQSLFWGEGETLLSIGPIAFKKEGAVFALVSMGRILLVMADFILFAMTTRPDTLMISMKQAGAPSSLAYIIVTTLQIVPRFQNKASTILDSQRSRGLETEGNIFVRARAFAPIVLPLVLGSLIEVEERAIAIQARGFNSNNKETSLIEIPDTRMQRLARQALLIITILSIIARIAWQLLN